MFGSESKEDKIIKLVQKKEWDKLKSKYLYSDSMTQVSLAKACAESKSDDCINIVLALLDEGEQAVKIAALETLNVIGSDRVATTLQVLYAKTPQSNEELRNAVMKTLQQVRGRR